MNEKADDVLAATWFKACNTMRSIKMTSDVKQCPRCEWPYQDVPALSRRDNKTDICPACGTEEAIIDAGGGNLIMKKRETKFMKHLGLESEDA